MISTCMSVIVMLVASVNGAGTEDEMQLCAKVQASSSVVRLGSPVLATCVIRDDCPLLIGQDVHIEWRLDDQILPNVTAANESSSRVSQIVIPSFNHTDAFLTCCVQGSTLQVAGGVEIRAGYPPEAPHNLSCQTNLTNSTLTCSWNPGQRDTHLLTKYTLHTKIWDLNMNYTYKLSLGDHQYIIPRSDFVLFSEMEIYMKAVNELGEAASTPIIVEPFSTAKFDPPMIRKVETVPKTYGCLKLSWSLSPHQAWIEIFYLSLEIRFKTIESSQWTEQPMLLSRVKSRKPANLCHLLHGTRYVVQIRVRYWQSPWSEWSRSQSAVTLESAPTGRLDWWMKVSGDHMHKQLNNIHLFWKPSKQFRANGQNVSYVVSMQKVPSEKGKVCATTGTYCTFQLPRRARKVYLSAVNAAGRSTPTDVLIYPNKAQTAISDLSAIPHDDTSLMVRWRRVDSSSPVGFVVEWRPLLEDLSHTKFEIADRNQTSLLLTGSFEPYKPYGISVYPRFKDGIGLPQTVNAYSRQTAPSMVPKLQITETSKSYVELTWDEIPLDKRNGIIQSYKIFYWNKEGPIYMENADLEERKVLLKDLSTAHLYEAFMMVSTSGGSLNGSMTNFEVKPFDTVAVVLIITASGVGLSLLIIVMVMTCFSNHRRLKRHLWPAVPDPANSSIKRWSSESTQDTRLPSDSEEPNPIYLSHLSFLDLPLKPNKEDDDPWLSNAEDTSDLGESICGSPFIPGYSGSNNDSVPYATVIFPGPCSSPTAETSHVYLRSESTQPLLETEESFTPKCYQNVANDGMPREQCFFGPCHEELSEDILWSDFPFLQALAMNDTEND